MQPALHQNPCAPQVDGLLNFVEDHFLWMNITLGVTHGPVEGAEAAKLSAEIRVIDIAVDNVAHDAVGVQLAPHRVGGHPDADQIVAAKEVDCLLASHYTETFPLAVRWSSSKAYFRKASRPAYSRSPSSYTMLCLR